MGSRDSVEDQRLDRMRAAVRASPRSTAFVALAHALCDAGLAAEAEVVSRQGLAHHPDLPTGQVALARAWLEGGTPARAERALRETIRLHPRHTDAYRWLAETLNRCGRAAEATEIWPRARSGDSQSRQLRRASDHAETVKLPTPEPGDTLTPPPTPPLMPRLTPPPMQTVPLTPLPTPPLLPLPIARNRDDEHTPTGSFPPISVTQDAQLVVEQHGRRRWSLWAGVSVVALAGALGAFWGFRQHPTPPAAGADTTLRVQLESDLHAGTLKRLLHVRDRARTHLAAQPRDEEVKVMLASALALLSYQYGIDAAADELASLTSPAADSNTQPPEVRPPASLGAQRDAALSLVALAHGNRPEAVRLAEVAAASAPEHPRVVVATAAARFRGGDIAGAINSIEQRPGPATGGPSGAMRLLLAAAHIDRGTPSAAVGVLQPMLEESEEAVALLLAADARRAGAKVSGATAGAFAARDASCLEASALSPVVAAWCALDEGIERRLSGDRAGALGKARQAAAPGVADPRILGAAAQLLANLGEIDQAAKAAAQASRFGAATLPAIAWAQVAVRIGRGEPMRPGKDLRPIGTESRLIAARAAIANGDAVVTGDDGAPSEDPDLRWLATLTRPMTPRDAALFADRLETQQPNPGPVGAYVAGMLARTANRRHLAERWLQQALTGHGDTCRAAREYKATLRQLKREGRNADMALPLDGHNSRCKAD